MKMDSGPKVQSLELDPQSAKLSIIAGHALRRGSFSRVVIGHIKRSTFISPFEEVTCSAQMLLDLLQSCVLMRATAAQQA